MENIAPSPAEMGMPQSPETVVLFQSEELRQLGHDALKGSGILDESPETVVLFDSAEYFAESATDVGETALGSEVVVDESTAQPTAVESITSPEEEGIHDQLSYLSSVEDLKSATGRTELQNWRSLLSGDIDEVSGGDVVHPNSKLAIKAAGAERDTSIMTFHDYVKTGVDYKALQDEQPTERFKFYHSFGDKAKAEEYLVDVIKGAKEAGISMSMKSFDHAYDGINIYTHNQDKMSEIIAKAYEAHPGAFKDTEHFLQGAVTGVGDKHIGWVQEPEAGLGHESHSGRMAKLGSVLDGKGDLTPEAYKEACDVAGVRPEAPWLLTPPYEAQLKQDAATNKAQRDAIQSASNAVESAHQGAEG